MVTEIVEDVYDITCRTQNGKRYRVYLATGGTPTLFDTALPETTDALVEGIDAVGIEPERLVITHGDPDHIGGYDAVVDRYDPTTWVPTQTEVTTEHDPDHRYGDGDRIGRFTAVHVPGHEPDNHVLIDEDAGVAVMGDAVSGADQRGFPAGHFHLPPGMYSDDLNEAEANLERLLAFDFGVGLVFHGSSVTAEASARLERYVTIPGT